MKKCVHCGTTENLTTEHIIPMMLPKWFGKDYSFVRKAANRTELCYNCNQKAKSIIIPNKDYVRSFYSEMSDEDYIAFCEFYNTFEEQIFSALHEIKKFTADRCFYCHQPLKPYERVLRRKHSAERRDIRNNCTVVCYKCNERATNRSNKFYRQLADATGVSRQSVITRYKGRWR